MTNVYWYFSQTANTNCPKTWRVCRSTEAKGSSINSKVGSVTSARAIEAREKTVQNAGQRRGQQQAEALKRLQRARAAR